MNDTNGNGHGGYARLRKVLADLEQKAAAVRTTLALLEGSDMTAKVERTGSGILADALALDSTRRRGRRPGSKNGNPSAASIAKTEGRRRVHAWLERFAPGDVVPHDEAAAKGALVTHGYLIVDGDGQYVRTDKPHYATEAEDRRRQTARELHTTREPGATRAKILAQREQTAAFLAAFDTRDIIDPTQAKRYKGFGMLHRYGYIRKTAKGWQRTAKPYHVTPEAETT